MPDGVGVDRNTIMTLTVWEDRASNLKNVMGDHAHRAAAKQSRELGSYLKTYHYESDHIPTWNEAKKLWIEKGTPYTKHQTCPLSAVQATTETFPTSA